MRRSHRLFFECVQPTAAQHSRQPRRRPLRL